MDFGYEYGDHLMYPQYGFGSWLKDNAAGLLKGAGAIADAIPIVGKMAGPIFDLAGNLVAKGQENKRLQGEADREQVRLDEIAAEQANIGRLSDKATRTSNIVNKNQIGYASTFALGGELMEGVSVNDLPMITEYSEKANTHQDGIGGIPVDAKGNPSSVSRGSTVGLTEAGEVTWNGYVFSNDDKLIV